VPGGDRFARMMAVGYTIAGILLGGALLLCTGIAVVIWLAVQAVRPELMERRRRGDAP
jgi:hypothetical protein